MLLVEAAVSEGTEPLQILGEGALRESKKIVTRENCECHKSFVLRWEMVGCKKQSFFRGGHFHFCLIVTATHLADKKTMIHTYGTIPTIFTMCFATYFLRTSLHLWHRRVARQIFPATPYMYIYGLTCV